MALDESSKHFIVDVPLGSYIVRWDMRNQGKLNSFRAHTDLITCVIKHISDKVSKFNSIIKRRREYVQRATEGK